MKPILVGEANPYGSEPRWALFPRPENSAGWRLRQILGLSEKRYLQAFIRTNLLDGDGWSARDARSRAALIASENHVDTPIVLLGRRVARAFGFTDEPFTARGAYVLLPHPSGRCRTWNEPDAVSRARGLVLPLIGGA